MVYLSLLSPSSDCLLRASWTSMALYFYTLPLFVFLCWKHSHSLVTALLLLSNFNSLLVFHLTMHCLIANCITTSAMLQLYSQLLRYCTAMVVRIEFQYLMMCFSSCLLLFHIVVCLILFCASKVRKSESCPPLHPLPVLWILLIHWHNPWHQIPTHPVLLLLLH